MSKQAGDTVTTATSRFALLKRRKRACIAGLVLTLAASGLAPAAFAASVSAGASHTVVVKPDGTVWSFGANDNGQLGDGTFSASVAAVQVPGATTFVSASAGGRHTVAVRSDGAVFSWGANDFGQLGNGNTTTKLLPVAVTGLSGVTAVVAGDDFSLALKSDGTVWAWGRNNRGQLGDASNTSSSVPVQVAGLSGVTKIAAGGAHGIARTNAGYVYAWGANDAGQLGDGTTTDRNTAAQLSSLAAIADVAAGSSHGLALKSDGTGVWAWGSNGQGQLGVGSTTPQSGTVLVTGLTSGVAAVSAARNLSMALKGDGTVYGWGENTYGQVGDGSTTQRTAPVAVSGLSGAASIEAGAYHAIAVSTTGVVSTWGRNDEGRLGNGTLTPKSVPTGIGTANYGLLQMVQWTNVVGATASGNTLTKASSGIAGWDAGAVSTRAIVSADGYLEFKAPAGSTLMAGLGNGDTNQTWPDLEYAFYLSSDGTLSIAQYGVVLGAYGTWTVNDFLRVAVEGGVVKFRKNGTLLYTSAVAPTFPLLVDTSILTPGASIVQTVIAGTLTDVGASAPSFSPPAGNYATAQVVTVTDVTPGVTIRYTTDGTEPTTSSASVASGGTVLINGPYTMLKAKAWGSGLFTSTTATAQYSIGTPTAENVQWTNVVGATASGNTLTKASNGIAGWDAGAVSTRAIVSADGYLEFKASAGSTLMAGLGNGDTNQTWPDLEYAFYLSSDGTLNIAQYGTVLGAYGTWTVNDVFRVAVEGGVVKFRKNGTLLYTSAVAPAFPLLVDTSILTPGASIIQAVIAGTLTDVAAAAPSFSPPAGNYATAQAVTVTDATPGVTIRYTTDGTEPTTSSASVASGGMVSVSGPYTMLKAKAWGPGLFTGPTTTAQYSIGSFATEAVQWRALVNASASGSTVTKTSGSNGVWDSGASSTKGIASPNGYVEFTGSPSYPTMAGLSFGDTSPVYDDIDFAIYLTGSSVQVYEAGTLRGTFTTFVATDVFRVAVEDGVLKYKKNGVTFYTSAVAPRYPLLVDASLNSIGGAVQNATLSGTLVSVLPEPVLWTNLVNVTANGNSITKASGVPGVWDAGAVSARAIASGDGYMEYQANSTNFVFGGLSNGDASAVYTDIDFGLHVANGAVHIWEAGNYRGQVATCVTSDVFRVAVENGVVKFRKNGTLIYTSTVAPTYPLLVDASLRDNGNSVNQVVLSGNLIDIAAAAPAFSPPGGSYATAQTVTITGPAGATIRYTTDGTDPTTSGSAIASGGTLSIAGPSTLLKARSFASGLLPSGSTAGNYAIGTTATEPVQWRALVNASASGSTVTKTSGSNGVWDSGASSTKGIASPNGYVEFTGSPSYPTMAGLSFGDTSPVYDDIDFAIYLTGSSVQVYEAGTLRGTFTTFVATDVFRVSIEDGVLKYKKNGVTFYTSTVAPRYPLLVDASLNSVGGAIQNATLSGTLVSVLPEPVQWTNLVNVTANGNSITKASGAQGIWDAGAVSTRAIASGDGYMEYQANSTNFVFGGLSNGDASPVYTDIDFGLHVANGAVHIWEAGINRGQVATCVSSDIFRVAVENGVVKYRQNGLVIYTSTVVPTYPLLVDTSLRDSGNAVNQVVLSGNLIDIAAAAPVFSPPGGSYATAQTVTITGPAGATIRYTTDGSDPTTSSSIIASGGSIPIPGPYTLLKARSFVSGLLPSGSTAGNYAIGTATTEAVQWRALVNASASGSTVTKTAGSNGVWDSGASSTKGIASPNGYVEFTGSPSYPTMAGLSFGDTSPVYDDIDFAIYLTGSSVQVYEAGTLRGTFTTFVATDVFRVSIEDGVLKYKKNGVTFYTSTVAPRYPLLVDASLNSVGGAIQNATLSGTLVSVLPEPVQWTNLVNVTANGNSITKASGAQGIWDAGAVSTRAIASGDGYMEYQANSTNFVFGGLSNGDASAVYTDIDFGLHVANGAVHIWEAGINRGQVATCVSSDIFRVAVENGVVKYRKNGTLIYTSTVAPTYPLLVDTSLRDSGNSVNQVVLAGNLVDVAAAAPLISPVEGTYTSAQTVTIAGVTPSVPVRFTIDGTSPTPSSALYVAPFSVSSATTVKAIATGPGYLSSPVAVAVFTFQAATPTISSAGGENGSPVTVTLSTTTAGATLRYTTDGATPTAASAQYSSPLTITSPTTVKALAIKAGWSNSPVASGSFAPLVATPVINPSSGMLSAGQLVTISVSTAGAAIYYTMDGSEPTAASSLYTGPLVPPLIAPLPLKARGILATWGDSQVATANLLPPPAPPVIDPGTGVYTADAVTISIHGVTGSEIRYSTDPLADPAAWPVYTAPFDVSTSAQVAAKQTVGGAVSAVATAQVEVSEPGVRTPKIAEAGAPAGSYALSGFETVNLYNGNLQFRLPLLNVGGRGEARFNMGLAVARTFQIRPTFALHANPNGGDPPPPQYVPLFNRWQIASGYGPGAMIGRRVANANGGRDVVLSFIEADGTEHELDGAASATASGTQCTVDHHARAGSEATFRAEPQICTDGESEFGPSGDLHLRDGRMFHVDAGRVTWLRDRNGNRMAFENLGGKEESTSLFKLDRVSKITDSLGRETTIAYAASAGGYDVISFKGANGAARTIRVERTPLVDAVLSVSDETKPDPIPGDTNHRRPFKLGELFPRLNWIPARVEDLYNPTVAKSVEIPDGRTYQLRYNRYGELVQVQLPTGGVIEYERGRGDDDASRGTEGDNSDTIYRRVILRRTRLGVGGQIATQTAYGPDRTSQLGTRVTVTHEDPAGGNRGMEVHQFRDSVLSASSLLSGKELSVATYADGTTNPDVAVPLSVEENDWLTQPGLNYEKNPRIDSTTTTLFGNSAIPGQDPGSGVMSRREFVYDSLNNPVEVREYDFGPAAAQSRTWGPLLRRTANAYLSDLNAGYVLTPVHLKGLRTLQEISDASGVVVARTRWDYDASPLAAAPDAVGTTPAFSESRRGNITASRRAILEAGSAGAATEVVSHYEYDVLGNLVRQLDPLQHSTLFSYADRFGTTNGAVVPPGSCSACAFVTSIQNAAGHSTQFEYDRDLGVVTDTSDPNRIVSSAYFEGDPLDRATRVVIAANNSDAAAQTAFTYDDANATVQARRDVAAFGDGGARTETRFDSLGRKTAERVFEPNGSAIRTETRYDAKGRPSAVSSPLRDGDEYGETVTQYDGMDRATAVIAPGNAATTTNYGLNIVLLSDPDGKKRHTVTDALGRISRVVEDPGGALEAATDYTYDVLGNLTHVIQGGQTRTFVYDSLSRLRSASNPESGTTTYDYDLAGNLLKKVDGRQIQTNFDPYDVLNRVTRRSYVGDTTPSVTYAYDDPSVSFSKGRVTAVTTSSAVSGSSAITAYDALGRIASQRQITDGIAFDTSARYQRGGGLLSLTYPSGLEVKYLYDSSGRLSGVIGDRGGTEEVFVQPNTVSYTASGAIAGWTLGNGVVETSVFNERQQPITLSFAPPASASGLELAYTYGAPTTNNGNVHTQTITIPGVTSLVQRYDFRAEGGDPGYDALNRLTRMEERIGGTGAPDVQTFSYDRFGNRRVSGDLTTYSTATNRIVGGNYDDAGNLKTLPNGQEISYDAESRQIEVSLGIGAPYQYFYDGEGRRVHKSVSGSLKSTFVDSPTGQLLVEESTIAPGRREHIYAGSKLIAVASGGADVPLPHGPVQIGPFGNIDTCDPDFDFTFRWYALEGQVSQYRLVVDGQVFGLYPASICSGDTCSVVPEAAAGVQPFAPGYHTWQVQGVDSSGIGGRWSDTWYFNLGPRPATPLTPSGIGPSSPTEYEWLHSIAASSYSILIDNTPYGPYVPSQVCTASSGTKCRVPAPVTNLSAGDHTWRVVGDYPQCTLASLPLSFKIDTSATCSVGVTRVRPSSSSAVGPQITFGWHLEGPSLGLDPDPMDFHISVTNADGATVFSRTFNVRCPRSNCSVNFATHGWTASVGSYHWSLTGGEGEHCFDTPFVVSLNPTLDQPVLLAPTSEVTSETVAFKWAQVPDAEQYALWVENADPDTIGNLLANDVCGADGVCQTTLAVDKNGCYKESDPRCLWEVKAISADERFSYNSAYFTMNVPCGSNFDCPGERCKVETGQCVECLNAAQCDTGAGQVCDQATNTCVDGGSCVPNSCPPGQTGLWTNSCGVQVNCGQCVPNACPAGQYGWWTNNCGTQTYCGDPPCQSNADCPGQRCKVSTGQCVECLNNAQCNTGAGEVCDQNTNTCVEPENCSTCPPGQTGLWTNSCGVQVDCGCAPDSCPAGQYGWWTNNCGTQTYCGDPPCTSNFDCPGGRCKVSTGQCVECLITANCNPGFYCDQSTNTCIEQGSSSADGVVLASFPSWWPGSRPPAPRRDIAQVAQSRRPAAVPQTKPAARSLFVAVWASFDYSPGWSVRRRLPAIEPPVLLRFVGLRDTPVPWLSPLRLAARVDGPTRQPDVADAQPPNNGSPANSGPHRAPSDHPTAAPERAIVAGIEEVQQ